MREAGSRDAAWPTVVHVTHPKAGSQWLHRILQACAGDRLVAPEFGVGHFLARPLEAGRIYPTVYVTRAQFDAVPKPADTRHFVVLRDLRDTLVSLYFSHLASHELNHETLVESRSELAGRGARGGAALADGPTRLPDLRRDPPILAEQRRAHPALRGFAAR